MKPALSTQGRVTKEEEGQKKEEAAQIKRKSPSCPSMIIDGKDNYKGKEAQAQESKLLQAIGFGGTIDGQYPDKREKKGSSK
jgi:hypothetical protein